jgi:hypothetical protein
VMWWLARQKYRVARALGSRAMRADAFQTDACFWLSLFLLVGLGLNALFGWWWADPLAALGMTLFIGREAIEAWRGEDEDEDAKPATAMRNRERSDAADAASDAGAATVPDADERSAG